VCLNSKYFVDIVRIKHFLTNANYIVLPSHEGIANLSNEMKKAIKAGFNMN